MPLQLGVVAFSAQQYVKDFLQAPLDRVFSSARLLDVRSRAVPRLQRGRQREQAAMGASRAWRAWPQRLEA